MPCVEIKRGMMVLPPLPLKVEEKNEKVITHYIGSPGRNFNLPGGIMS
jgi:hypothetical protein